MHFPKKNKKKIIYVIPTYKSQCNLIYTCCHWTAVKLFICLDVLLPVLLFINIEEAILLFNMKDWFIHFSFLTITICHLQLYLSSKKFPLLYQVQKTTKNIIKRWKMNEWRVAKYQEWKKLCGLVLWNSCCYPVHDNLQLASHEQGKEK